MIGHISTTYSESWKDVNWRQLRKTLFRLQHRVWKAVRNGNKAKARNIQKLIINSYSARMLAIRQVTQLNQGRKTAGIDGKKSLTFRERFQLEKTLKTHAKDWKHKGLRKIPIPKKDGTKRILKVPTMADRAYQCLIKYALEPAHEAEFHAQSYGFRTGRSAHDAQKKLFHKLSSNVNGKEKRILELDIEKCFDRISHTAIMNRLIAPTAIKNGIFRCLKAGVNPEFPEQGTCQGGVVSPLLANIALNGIERIGEYRGTDYVVRSKCIRYADDMVYILNPKDDVKEILKQIEEFLAQRGMNISQKKTKLTASTDGFNFLGWKFYVQHNGKFKSTPSEENFKTFRKKVKNIVNSSSYGARVKMQKLAPIIRGWRKYHRYCNMEGSRHSLWFMDHRTFKVFNKEEKLNKESAKALAQRAFPVVGYQENGFINVKGEKSPYDGDTAYWSQRNSKLYDGATSRVLKRQKHSCGFCRLKFGVDEIIHLHHIDGNHQNWKNNNLLVVHQSCHQYHHMSQTER